MNITIIGGNFDDNGGEKSTLTTEIYETLKTLNSMNQTVAFNGGTTSMYKSAMNALNKFDNSIVVALTEKAHEILHMVKTKNPHLITVGMVLNKFAVDYNPTDIMNVASEKKMDFIIEREYRENDGIYYRLFDKYCNLYSEYTDSLKVVTRVLYKKILAAYNTDRYEIFKMISNIELKPSEDFIKILNEYDEKLFNEFLPEASVKDVPTSRMFRPYFSFRIQDNGCVGISKENLIEKPIDINSFVEADYREFSNHRSYHRIMYFGDHHPSFDIAMHLNIYSEMLGINYILHTHYYIENARFTSGMWPDNSVKLSDEISLIVKNAKMRDSKVMALNLNGHGSVIAVADLADLKDIPYVKKAIPEMWLGK